MKVCPICQNTYEDWIDFCFQDGSPLAAGAAPPPAPKLEKAKPAPPSSAFDAPEPRIAGVDAPEPNLARFKKPAAHAVPDALGAPARPPVHRSRAGADLPASPLSDAGPVSSADTALRAAPLDAAGAAAAEDLPAAVPIDVPAPRGEAAAAPPPAKAELISIEESEDGKPTVPMYTPMPEPDLPRGRSVLDDDEPPSRRNAVVAAGGLGIVAIGGIAALLVIGAVGGWWYMNHKPNPVPKAPVQVVRPPPVRPAPPVQAPPPPPPIAVAPAPVEPGPVEPAPVEPTPVPPTPVAMPTPPRPTPPRSTPPRPGPAIPSPVLPRPTPSATPVTQAGSTSENPWGAQDAASSGVLKINSDPVGASIYVNDELKGRAPVSVDLPYGRHRIRAVQSGYKTEVSDVNLSVREMAIPMRLTAELQQGQVNVYGPAGATVWVDNHDMGPLPVTVLVTEGLRQFKLALADGTSCTISKEVRFAVPGRPFTVNLSGCQ